MENGKTRTALAAVLGLIMVGSIAAVASPAFAASGSLFLNVSPKKATLGVGDDIVLSGDFKTDVGNDIIKVVVTLLGSRHEFAFDKDGGIIDHDSAFKKPHTTLTVLGKNTNDPYEISKQRLQFWVPIKKNVLGVGDYKALVEVVTNSGTFDQTESFKILPKPRHDGGGHGNGNHDSNLSVISVIVNSSGRGNNNINVIAVVINNGKSSSGAFNVNAVLSNSGGGNGISLASVNVNSLGAGQTSIVALNGHTPSGSSSSSSQLISVNADSNNSVDESNEHDNHMSKPYRHY